MGLQMIRRSTVRMKQCLPIQRNKPILVRLTMLDNSNNHHHSAPHLRPIPLRLRFLQIRVVMQLINMRPMLLKTRTRWTMPVFKMAQILLTAASGVAEDNPIRGTGSFRPNICTVSPDRKRLCPTRAVSLAMTDTFHRMWFEEGHSWKSLLPNQVEFYWQEFKKKFQWNEPEAVVRAAWVNLASTRYTDNLSKYRLKYERTGVIETHIKQEIWDAWFKKWDTPEYKVKRQKMSSNRQSEKAGPGSGMSRHTCGTKSMLDRHIRTGNPSNTKLNLHKNFLETHTRKGKPSEFIDELSRQFEERYQEIYGNKAAAMGEGVDAQDCMLQSYVEAAEGFDSHSRLYGVGSLGKSVKDGEQLFAGGEMNIAQNDPEAAATIAALKAKVKLMESEDAALKSKLAMLVIGDAERMSMQQELQSQVSQLTALVQSLIPGTNGGQV